MNLAEESFRDVEIARETVYTSAHSTSSVSRIVSLEPFGSMRGNGHAPIDQHERIGLVEIQSPQSPRSSKDFSNSLVSLVFSSVCFIAER